ncbi:MAG: hypothetical protein F4X34_09590 [Chloroflexi bacterium]|nr:hypothetical protein [Chloroflexota bacterium]
MSSVTNPRGRLLLDASCLLNLYATGRMQDIAASTGYQFEVADYVLQYETLYVLQTNSEGAEDERIPVDLDSLIEEGLLYVVELEGEDVLSSFVQLASLVDDGEAVTGALALHRDCSVAIDDRKARRVLGEVMPDVAHVSTLELMRLWAQEASVPVRELREALMAMQIGASYVPGRRDPLYDWWTSAVSKSS